MLTMESLSQAADRDIKHFSPLCLSITRKDFIMWKKTLQHTDLAPHQLTNASPSSTPTHSGTSGPHLSRLIHPKPALIITS